jgi:uncharacterized membrane protein YczE
VESQATPRSALRDATWRPNPSQLVRLLCGLTLFGIGEALLVLAALGNSPWTVLAAGVAEQTGLKIGTATILISVVVLLIWIPLRERPGFGTLANAIVIGLVIDATLAVLDPPGALGLRVALVATGIALVGLGSGLYINAALGRGPRDGLMTAIHHPTGRSIALVRTVIEVGVMAVGVVLGGLFGPATIAFALLIGPAVHVALRLLPAAPRPV